MKKTLAFVLCIAILAILAATPVMAAHQITITAPKVAGITIDGVKDDGYSDWIPLDFCNQDDGATGKIAVAWDDNNIYCIVEVYDKTPFHDNTTDWQTDNVEFFFDWNNKKGESIDNDDEPFWQARIHSAPGENDYAVTAHANEDWNSDDLQQIKYKVVPLSGSDLSNGYIIEAAFPAAAVGENGRASGTKLVEGKVLGFDATISDAHDNDSRYSTAFFFNHADYDMGDNMWQNPSVLKALLTLGAAKAAAVEPEAPVVAGPEEPVGITPEVPVLPTAPKPTAPKTGDPMIIIALGSILSAAGVVIARKRK